MRGGATGVPGRFRGQSEARRSHARYEFWNPEERRTRLGGAARLRSGGPSRPAVRYTFPND